MIGIDLVDINRFKNKKSSFLNKFFSKKELKESKDNNFYNKIAGKWAAKEAAFKAGFNFSFKEIEILTKNNKPNIFIKNKKNKALVSISHEKDYATAIVIKIS